MAGLKVLSRPHQDIQVGDRQFRLNQFTLDELNYYLSELQALAPKAVAALDGNPIANYAKALDVATVEGERLILWLLREPIDGKPAPDAEWYRRTVTTSIQRDIQDEVYEINNLEAVLGEAMRLMEMARGPQTPTGLTSSTPLPTDTEPTP